MQKIDDQTLPTEALQTLRATLVAELTQRHGLILGGVHLAHALGHRSTAALRQARRRGQVTVQLFTLPHRKGSFALATEVAEWLAQARLQGNTSAGKEASPAHD